MNGLAMKTKEELQRLREEWMLRLRSTFADQFDAGVKVPYDFRPGSLNSVIGIGAEQLRNRVVQHGDTVLVQKRTSPVTIAPLRQTPTMPSRPLPGDDYEHCIWLAEFHEKAGNFEDAAKCYDAASERQPGRKAKRYKEPVWLRMLRWLVS